ncbi:hypothetical protein AVKW3434_20105 [Acidovorax sp. SUPP3434]|uniref:hypothetical protein n=1 Tax=Acidovorax sp. SUPP3434 TaxID=2920880 RepID=UPI0023DE5914|nr:hypothetical protein [Acidovorax sp. SUPP3434]GKT01732.1 hypothetical protein AVKW3434_20105 [Acidovorax sp. SUPP3434]
MKTTDRAGSSASAAAPALTTPSTASHAPVAPAAALPPRRRARSAEPPAGFPVDTRARAAGAETSASGAKRRRIDPTALPQPGRPQGRAAETETEAAPRRARSASPDSRPAHRAGSLPFAQLVGEAAARGLERDWGTLQSARVKNGHPQIHPWEEALHPQRVSIPPGNPRGVRLPEVLDLQAIREGTPVLWSIGMGATLHLGPHARVETPAGETAGKERRMGHPSLVAGTRDEATGDWWGKQTRISGELLWDAQRETFFITNQSGRYSRHPDRGAPQMAQVARHFEEGGMVVEVRLIGAP